MPPLGYLTPEVSKWQLSTLPAYQKTSRPVDILAINETRSDFSFPNTAISIPGYSLKRMPVIEMAEEKRFILGTLSTMNKFKPLMRN